VNPRRATRRTLGVGLVVLLTVSCAGGRSATTASSTSTTSTTSSSGTTCVPRVDLIVFVNPAAGSAAVEAVEESLTETEGVASVTSVDQQEAYDEFLRLFADNPEAVANVRPEDLPPSFRLTLDDPQAADLVQADAESLDGVGQVIVPDPPADPSVIC
jgi:cell division protein FtsX